MTSCLFKLYLEMENIAVPDGYVVSFAIENKRHPGKSGRVTVKVVDEESGYRCSWAISEYELANHKLDFVKENIEAMIEDIQEKAKRYKEEEEDA